MNALDLTTLANVKSWLGITVGTFDTDLSRLITSASAFAQNVMNRTIASTAYSEQRDGHGGTSIITSNYPILSVASVVIDGVVVPSANYSSNANGIYLTSGAFNRAKNNVTLNYTAGFASTPQDLEQAIIETIAVRWKEKDRIGMSSKSLAGETTSFMIKDFPPSAQTLLNQYKKVISLL